MEYDKTFFCLTLDGKIYSQYMDHNGNFYWKEMVIKLFKK